MNPTEVFAGWMRAARESTGASQQDVADHVGLWQQAIAKIETGKRSVSLDEAVAIASFFGVTVTEAIGSTVESANAELVRLRQPSPELVRLRGVLARVRSAVNDHEPAGDES